MIDINNIRIIYNKGAVVLTQHFLDRIGIRGISLKNISTIINDGEIIERYPDDYPHPSMLLSGCIEDNTPVHVVLGAGNGVIWLITAYHPDSEKWENDNKTRKAEIK